MLIFKIHNFTTLFILIVAAVKNQQSSSKTSQNDNMRLSDTFNTLLNHYGENILKIFIYFSNLIIIWLNLDILEKIK
jgi:hypothetical protein